MRAAKKFQEEVIEIASDLTPDAIDALAERLLACRDRKVWDRLLDGVEVVVGSTSARPTIGLIERPIEVTGRFSQPDVYGDVGRSYGILAWLLVGLDPELRIASSVTHAHLSPYLLGDESEKLHRLAAQLDFTAFANLKGLSVMLADDARPLPAGLGALVGLESLSVSYHARPVVNASETPAELFGFDLAQLANLQSLDISTARSSFEMSDIGGLVNLRRLHLRFVSQIPSGVAELRNLESLVIEFAEGQELPTGLGALVNLREAEFRNLKLTSVPEDLFDCVSLVRLDLSGNRLRSLSPRIANLTRLQELSLKENRLAELPDDLGGLPDLSTLLVDPAVDPDALPEHSGVPAQDTVLRSASANQEQLEVLRKMANSKWDDAVVDANLGDAEAQSDLWREMAGLNVRELRQEEFASDPEAEARLTAALQPVILINAISDDGEFELGTTRFGGRPDVPLGFEWPALEDDLMGFRAQIDCRDLSLFVAAADLPEAGLLSFFVHAADDDGRVLGCAVYHFAEGQKLQRTGPHMGLSHSNAIAPAARLELTEAIDYSAAVDWYDPGFDYNAKMFGHMDVTHVGREEFATLLLQIGSDVCDWLWLDGFNLAVTIDQEDLRRQVFDSVIASPI